MENLSYWPDLSKMDRCVVTYIVNIYVMKELEGIRYVNSAVYFLSFCFIGLEGFYVQYRAEGYSDDEKLPFFKLEP